MAWSFLMVEQLAFLEAAEKATQKQRTRPECHSLLQAHSPVA